jgi:hypothetical protein
MFEQSPRELLGGTASFALTDTMTHLREERSGGHRG